MGLRLLVALFLIEATACATTTVASQPSDSRPPDDALCIGPKEAQTFAVYLHGVDNPSPAEQEQNHRRVLAQAANQLSIRFALPRASQACGSSICWGWQLDAAQRRAAVTSVLAAAERCFPPAARYGLLGFSSGGYLVLSLFRTCELPTLLPKASWAVAVGSAMIRGPIEPDPADLSTCGAVSMLIGTDDLHNNDPTDNYLHRLEAKHAKVSVIPFSGGHELPARPLIELLPKVIDHR